MCRLTAVCVVALLLAFVGPAAQAGYDINFFLGQKMLDDDDWDPIEDQTEFGVTSTFGSEDWPIAIAADLLISGDDDETGGFDPMLGQVRLDIDATVTELDLGVRKIWERNKIRPFVGGGVAFAQVDIEFDAFSSVLGFASADEDDNGTGVWVNGGVFWRIGEKLNLGFEIRVTRAEVDFAGDDLEAGGEHFGLIIGWGK